MSTATEKIVNMVFINDVNYGFPTYPSGVKYTVPAGRYAEIYIQRYKSENDNGQVASVKIGEVALPAPLSQDSVLFAYGSDTQAPYSQNPNATHSMARTPITLYAGQTIYYNIGISSVLDFTAVIKEYNAP